MKPAHSMPNAAVIDWGRNAAFRLQKCPGWTAHDRPACASSTTAFLQPEGCAQYARISLARPELALFVLLLALFNWPVWRGSAWHSMIFLPAAMQAGEWWRLITHPFVHVSWYHLLLDGAAFLMLYQSLAEQSLVRRLTYVLAVGAGSLLISWWAAPAISMNGLCGLSGIAHGLMAVSALEMVGVGDQQSAQRRVGWATLFLVTSKSALEALTGTAFFSFLHFGLMGTPIAVSHAGGVLGGLCAWLLFHAAPAIGSKGRDIEEPDSMPLRIRAKTTSGFGTYAPSPRPSPIRWERENVGPPFDVAGCSGPCDGAAWRFPLPSDGRGSG
ncbi:MAG: rhombosortase [Chloroflexi bacterium]|nr:rhombosortase [Chloroflexota bacterium]